jgi:hypothetical protein
MIERIYIFFLRLNISLRSKIEGIETKKFKNSIFHSQNECENEARNESCCEEDKSFAHKLFYDFHST